jgi:hypothetical protein
LFINGYDDPVTVNISTSGDAVEGVDYLGAIDTTHEIVDALSSTIRVDPVATTDDVDVLRSLTVTIEPGPGYTVGSPSSKTMEIRRGSSYCKAPMFLPDPVNSSQAIHVGEGLAALAVQPAAGFWPPSFELTSGELPPGIALTTAGFDGTATAPGTFVAHVAACQPSRTRHCVDDLLTVTVMPPDLTANLTADAAEPISAMPRFTG